jgi:hypothetical protein
MSIGLRVRIAACCRGIRLNHEFEAAEIRRSGTCSRVPAGAGGEVVIAAWCRGTRLSQGFEAAKYRRSGTCSRVAAEEVYKEGVCEESGPEHGKPLYPQKAFGKI